MFLRQNLALKLIFVLIFCALLYLTIDMAIFKSMEYCYHQKSKIIDDQKILEFILKVSPKIADSILCYEKDTKPKTAIRGDHWVLYNLIPALVTYKCNETITYTTHCDHTFLDNLIPLLKRWQGPISISLYTPGSDFFDAMKGVAYYR